MFAVEEWAKAALPASLAEKARTVRAAAESAGRDPSSWSSAAASRTPATRSPIPLRRQLADMVRLPPRLEPSSLAERGVLVGAIRHALDSLEPRMLDRLCKAA